MAVDPLSVVPRHKFDTERLDAAIALGYPGVAPVVPQLLRWIEDANWPVAPRMGRFLASIGEPVFPYVRDVLASGDPIWKYWCINLFIRELPRVRAEAFRPDLERLAFQANREDVSDEVDEQAREALDWLDGLEPQDAR